ncbi:hypothetical protein P7C73_g6491, partial [Tremellales sp. Uapishka_1]
MSKALARLPLFFAYCPDYPNALAKRLGVRAQHFERFKRAQADGLVGEWLASYPFLSTWRERGLSDTWGERALTNDHGRVRERLPPASGGYGAQLAAAAEGSTGDEWVRDLSSDRERE